MADGSAPESQEPWLSLLVPAYEYPEGLTRILDTLEGEEAAGVECRVHDDSRGDGVHELVRAHLATARGRVHYLRNQPPLGAVRNWNSLMANARGDYVMVMHHDEFPASPEFFTQLQAELRRLQCPDVLILGCLVPSGAERWRRHMPAWLKGALLQTMPAHLLRHNTLGPTATVVIRRGRLQPFDERLQWLVDVEWMHRLLTEAGTRWALGDLDILSSQKPGASITAALADRTADLARQESRVIQERLGRVAALRLQAPETWWEKTLSVLEQLVWWGVRAVMRPAGLLARQPRQSRS